jgi:hypothetical protein
MYYIYRLYIWYLSMTLLFFYKEVDENGLLRNHDAIVYRAGRCPKYVVGAPFPSPMAYRCSHEPRSSGAGPDRRGTYVQATSHHTRSIWMAMTAVDRLDGPDCRTGRTTDGVVKTECPLFSARPWQTAVLPRASPLGKASWKMKHFGPVTAKFVPIKYSMRRTATVFCTRVDVWDMGLYNV